MKTWRRWTCERCPKRDKNGVCVIYAKLMVPRAPACEYGRRMIGNAYAAEWMRRRHGHKKRTSRTTNKGANDE